MTPLVSFGVRGSRSLMEMSWVMARGEVSHEGVAGDVDGSAYGA